ncbi:MAG: hypothetical protein A3E87_02890 [Gammaproteobacteria bacterium RIFCSPHIGHO2_12_FULL_35_23]|nr:MAG: hypothetical protein A3E87_02890 [Gammaproteobacteria bacterium RIFCSPHIGHO2_12_FULL_35_23]
MQKGYSLSLLGSLSVLLVACSSSINPGENSILISFSPPPKQCQYLHLLTDQQGSVIELPSPASLQASSLDQLKLAAYAVGANYIELVTINQVTQLANRTTHVAVGGKAYHCPN